ncbi:hypothetical protein VP14_208 [Vibrio phage VPMCC14]|nr:hypothetical protein VP14_208 [Vibrio phage VPMCC14]
MQHTIKIPNGILHYSTVDLEFEFEGRTCYMEFHHYCGPMFYWKRSEDEIDKLYEETGKLFSEEEEIFADDSQRFDKLWEEFNNWFNKPEQQHLHYKGED